jgi:hypothetical protein
VAKRWRYCLASSLARLISTSNKGGKRQGLLSCSMTWELYGRMRREVQQQIGSPDSYREAVTIMCYRRSCRIEDIAHRLMSLRAPIVV